MAQKRLNFLNGNLREIIAVVTFFAGKVTSFVRKIKALRQGEKLYTWLHNNRARHDFRSTKTIASRTHMTLSRVE